MAKEGGWPSEWQVLLLLPLEGASAGAEEQRTLQGETARQLEFSNSLSHMFNA